MSAERLASRRRRCRPQVCVCDRPTHRLVPVRSASQPGREFGATARHTCLHAIGLGVGGNCPTARGTHLDGARTTGPPPPTPSSLRVRLRLEQARVCVTVRRAHLVGEIMTIPRAAGLFSFGLAADAKRVAQHRCSPSERMIVPERRAWPKAEFRRCAQAFVRCARCRAQVVTPTREEFPAAA